jgi:hypothetical protein
VTPHPSLQWNEILAAYADGEFEGRDDLALLKQRVESWLKSHPEAHAELAQYRRLKQLWVETTPPEPTPAEWRAVLAAIEARRTAELEPRPRLSPWSPRTWRIVAAVAVPVAACLALAVVWSLRFSSNVKPIVTAPAHVLPESYEVLSVATMDEVEILRVEGADTGTLVVGALPVHGPLELADPGEVTVTSIEPDARDQMVPVIRSAGRPMIWARLDSE